MKGVRREKEEKDEIKCGLGCDDTRLKKKREKREKRKKKRKRKI